MSDAFERERNALIADSPDDGPIAREVKAAMRATLERLESRPRAQVFEFPNKNLDPLVESKNVALQPLDSLGVSQDSLVRDPVSRDQLASRRNRLYFFTHFIADTHRAIFSRRSQGVK